MADAAHPSLNAQKTALLYEVGQVLASLLDLDELLAYLTRRVMEVFEAESAAVMLLDASGEELRFPYVDDRDPEAARRLRDLAVPRDRGLAGWVLTNATPALVADAASDPRFYGGVDASMGRTTRDLVCAPLRTRGGVIGVIEAINKREGRFSEADLELLDALSGTVAIAIENARLVGELKAREATLQREVTSLRRVAAAQHQFDGIVATSPAMEEVLRLMESASDTPVSVLIEGETGTGKELVARAIHYSGARKSKRFVPINCAALNENLLESELFGHRKGAFTGALSDKRGLFEVAHEGTVFLDEIGDASPGFQARLLRLLQEGELVPVGDTTPRRVNVRIVSATNRDLEEDVRAGRFREDLYYRIATFPIPLPPLRERRQDIPILVEHLLRRAATRLEKEVAGVDPAALALLEAYEWPGNVRELQNEIERAVSLAPRGGKVVPAQLSEKIRSGVPRGAEPATTESLWTALERFEREHLRRALAEHAGNVSRAARALGISRVVLQRKMKSLGLRTPAPESGDG
jgi:Nif-specific regulatory protein